MTMKKNCLIFAGLVCVLAPSAFAQDTPVDGLGDYTPPPMFGAPPARTLPAPQPAPAPSYYAPVPTREPPARVSRRIIPEPGRKPVIPAYTARKISHQEMTASAAPANPALEKNPEPALSLTKLAPAVGTDIPDPQKEEKPVKKQQGIVRGPKTMPAVPAEKVDEDILYQPAEEAQEKTLLERHQAMREEEAQEKRTQTALHTPPVPVQKPKGAKEQGIQKASILAPAASTESKLKTVDDNVRKLTLPFAPSLSALDQKQIDSITQDIVVFLSGNPDWRVQVQAFASAQDEGISSDRRMALSRALAVREALLEQDIPAARIDVRALGARSREMPLDRVDIFLIGPGRS